MPRPRRATNDGRVPRTPRPAANRGHRPAVNPSRTHSWFKNFSPFALAASPGNTRRESPTLPASAGAQRECLPDDSEQPFLPGPATDQLPQGGNRRRHPCTDRWAKARTSARSGVVHFVTFGQTERCPAELVRRSPNASRVRESCHAESSTRPGAQTVPLPTRQATEPCPQPTDQMVLDCCGNGA